MGNVAFDPGGFYEFSLESGSVKSRDGARVVVVSDSVMANLVSAAVERGDVTAVRQLGKHLGQSVSRAVGGDAASATPEEVMGYASATLALFGWGRLALERWGDALVAVVKEVPTLDADNLGVAALLGGMFSQLMGKEVVSLPADREGRFLLVAPPVAEQIWTWYKHGDSLPEMVERLGSSAAL